MNYSSADVKCCFYVDDTRNTIKCEGFISDVTVNKFTTAKTKKKHYEKKCCDNYRKCRLYRALEMKY